ncbi:hypothetical protein A3A84_01860 [Candidatus Collierbacteria bacterium RIFCSPLOWO2_01_FULL_50_23]|uniref:Uncharacterized protein n=1 Tax=Candidatus Collierbacteria bacterium RIFCSPHIGHO2_01_FULL_50_25 TaxID=1817722 RepID=A0A1F5EXU5_9BACT|nr:MAG: hypothetical protein A2703_00150 [Candidatus Collierbacteria bacterium RIFCSPHIGHO2_01_FULL_50_25]OGD74140.1 MAG: hypothetical protein A3A84_01860 [Candidatus Collierbacteria bacterium RIFCSPLOWO2_01_FULL_50_23]
MAKKRTRAQKIKASGFKVTFGAINSPKVHVKVKTEKQNGLNYFRSDLTKVLLLTMLALASEVVLWLILKH